MSVILVTGAGGYIGSTLVPLLLSEGYWVRAVDRFFFGQHRLGKHRRLELIQEDTRRLHLDHFTQVDAVIDLVAISNDPSSELFKQATWDINYRGRLRCAQLARQAGVKRYLLPSSCSIYGFNPPDEIVDELAVPNPLTPYSQANLKAEQAVLQLADEHFVVVVLRQATVYGCSPRMRFDLAINGMTYGAFTTGKLPLMRDGTQWRPMLHVRDAARALIFMLQAPDSSISGQIFNVGSADNVYQIQPLGELVAELVPRQVDIEWYGSADQRSYRVDFTRIEQLGYRTQWTAHQAVAELCEELASGRLVKTDDTITLEWYQKLERWHQIIQDTAMHGGILEITPSSSNNSDI